LVGSQDTIGWKRSLRAPGGGIKPIHTDIKTNSIRFPKSGLAKVVDGEKWIFLR
jgi:hypothetical protein